MSDEGSITRWISGLRAGDAMATSAVWRRFYDRLVHMARRKLGDLPKRASDEEDIVVDAFDSFCRGVKGGRFPDLADRDDLWQVLMMLTARKASNQRKHDQREKRGGGMVRGESVFRSHDNSSAGIDQFAEADPSPELAEEVSEEVRRLLDLLGDDTLRTVAIAKLEGFQNAEIAEKLQVQTRTVERKLRTIREIWSAEEFDGP